MRVRGDIMGSKRVIFASKVYNYRPLILIFPIGLEKLTKRCWVMRGNLARHIKYFLEESLAPPPEITLCGVPNSHA